jgi:ribonuclease Z
MGEPARMLTIPQVADRLRCGAGKAYRLAREWSFIVRLGDGPNAPLRVPEDPLEAKYGIKYAVERFREMVTWDLDGRRGLVDDRGYHIEPHEFDYKDINQVFCQENSVTIRSWPAIHSLDGPVSLSLEWKGLTFVFGSDTYPNKWFVSCDFAT